jgi:alcohol dehydrogenase class IV
MVLPHILRFSAPAVTDRLAQLAVQAKLHDPCGDEEALAEKFLGAVESLNRDLQIPLHLDALKAGDIPALARAALKEAHTGYPVPRYMTQAQCEEIIARLLPPAPAKPAAKKAVAKKPAAKKPAAKTNTPARATKA